MLSAPLFAEPLTVNWYHKQSYLQPVVNAFVARTGIDVEVTSDYDTFSTDVIFVSDYKGLLETRNFGHFRQLSPEFFSKMSLVVPKRWRDMDGYWLGVALRVRTAVVNNKLVAAADRPTHLLDLADPKWAGKMTIRTSENVYNRSLLAYMIYRYGRDAATHWARGIVHNSGSSSEYSGDTWNAKKVATGQFSISFINSYYLGYLQTRTGRETEETLRKLRDDLDVVWLDSGEFGLPVNVTGVGISSKIDDNSEKLEQAERFVEFILSKDGQSLLTDHVYKYPVRSDVEPSAFLRSFGDFRIDTYDINSLRYLYDDADRIMRGVGWQ